MKLVLEMLGENLFTKKWSLKMEYASMIMNINHETLAPNSVLY
jgi:hypothetical protein